MKNAARIGTEIGEAVVERWRQTDETADAMLRLTRMVTRLTWVLLVLGAAAVVVPLID